MSQTTINRDRRIKTLIIKNFQNHKYTNITFDNGLNIIAGSSDCGKTAISRAIFFALYNRASGDDYVYFGEKKAEVYIEFFDSSVFIRTKGKNINTAQFKYPEDSEFTVFAKVGTHYNQQILNFLGMPLKLKY